MSTAAKSSSLTVGVAPPKSPLLTPVSGGVPKSPPMKPKKPAEDRSQPVVISAAPLDYSFFGLTNVLGTCARVPP